MVMKNIRAKAMVLAFMKGAPIPPNDLAAKIVVTMCWLGFNGFDWKMKAK